MTQMNLEDAQRLLPDLIAAAERGEEVVIMKEDRPIAKLVAIPPPQESLPERRFGSSKGSILFMDDDFDAPMEDFREYEQ